MLPEGAGRRDPESLPADFLDAALEDRDILELQNPCDVPKKGALLLPGLDERQLKVRPGDREGKAGEAGAGADINNPFSMSN